MKRRSDRVLHLIALFRFSKALLLIISGLGALRLLDPERIARVTQWVAEMPFTSQHAFMQRVVVLLTRMTPKRVEELAIAAFLYAALFITEGTGLWMDKVWAEWLTIIATLSFIPFEVYEVVHKTTFVRAGILALNIAIVGYLIYRRKTSSRGVA